MNPSRICPVSQVLRDPTGGWGPDYWREAEVAAAARELTLLKSDPVSLDTVWTTMTAAKEAGHEGQGAEADHDSWQ
jgi:hypothetical protein